MKLRSLSLILFFACLFLLPQATEAAATLQRIPVNNLNLTGYWTMDGTDTNWGSNTMTDRSGNGNTATMTNMSTTSSPINGKIGQALRFDGVNDYLNFGDILDVGSGSFTISTFVKLRSTADQGIVAKRNNSVGTESGYSIKVESGSGVATFYFGDGTTGSEDSAVSQDLSDNNWHHVAMVIDRGGNRKRGYVDGVQIVNVSISSIGTQDSAAVFQIGRSGGSRYAVGNIDDVRVYNRAFGADEIKALSVFGLATAGASSADLTKGTTLENGLVGLWTMDGTDTLWGSNTMTDRSGNGVTGTLANMSTSSSPTLGKLAQALKFNAANDGIVLASDPIDTNTVTACAWIYPTSPNNGGAIIGNGRFYLAVYVQNYQIRLNSNSSLGGDLLSTTNIVATSTWQHVCGVRNSGANGPATIYLNGVSVASGNTNTPTSGFGLAIGDHGTGGGQSWSGSIDDVRIYNRALSVSEINQLYRLGQATASASQNQTGGTLDSGLSVLWSFDGADMNWGTGRVLDRSGNSNNGFIAGMSTTTSPKIGKVGQALAFNGVSGRLTSSYSLGAYPTSVCFWFKYDDNTPFLSEIFGDSEFLIYLINQAGDDDDYLQIYNNNSSLNYAYGIMGDGIWHHTCAAISSDNLATGYINGVLTNGPSSIGAPPGTAGNFSIVSPQDYKGMVDEVRIYNRLLSAEEIKTLYNMGR